MATGFVEFAETPPEAGSPAPDPVAPAELTFPSTFGISLDVGPTIAATATAMDVDVAAELGTTNAAAMEVDTDAPADLANTSCPPLCSSPAAPPPHQQQSPNDHHNISKPQTQAHHPSTPQIDSTEIPQTLTHHPSTDQDISPRPRSLSTDSTQPASEAADLDRAAALTIAPVQEGPLPPCGFSVSSALRECDCEPCYWPLVSRLCGDDSEFLRDIEETDLIGQEDGLGRPIPVPVARGLVRKLRKVQGQGGSIRAVGGGAGQDPAQPDQSHTQLPRKLPSIPIDNVQTDDVSAIREGVSVAAASDAVAAPALSTEKQDKLVAELVSMGFETTRVAALVASLGESATLEACLEQLLGDKAPSLDLPPASEASAVASAEIDSGTTPSSSWDCGICFTSQSSDHGWRCKAEGQHRYCTSCMRGYAEAEAAPRCPGDKCSYKLQESDLRFLHVSQKRIDAFVNQQLNSAVDRLGAVADATTAGTARKAEEMVVRCPNMACGNAVVVSAKERRRYVCVCGQQPFCTHCRQSPYHYHGACGDVQGIRERWLDWVSGGRERYSGHASASATYEDQLKTLKEGLDRHREMSNDEEWKSRHCRACPHCRRPIQRISGCSSMKCGADAHGGNEQPGCGAEFDWGEARPYKAHVTTRELPKLTAEEARCRGHNAFHAFAQCEICGKEGLRGPRFQCLHCPQFDVCMDCEPNLLTLHQAGHVFRIAFESDLVWAGMRLPARTRVRVVRRDEELPRAEGDPTPALPPPSSSSSSPPLPSASTTSSVPAVPAVPATSPPLTTSLAAFSTTAIAAPAVATSSTPAVARVPARAARPGSVAATLKALGATLPPALSTSSRLVPTAEQASAPTPTPSSVKEGDVGTVLSWVPPEEEGLARIQSFEWQCGGGWRPFEERENAILLAATKTRKVTVNLTSKDGHRYVVDLLKMEQRNVSSGRTRAIRGSSDKQTPTKPPCRFFQRGFCRLGEACRFQHLPATTTTTTTTTIATTTAAISAASSSSSSGLLLPSKARSKTAAAAAAAARAAAAASTAAALAPAPADSSSSSSTATAAATGAQDATAACGWIMHHVRLDSGRELTISAQFLEPIITSRKEAEDIVKRSMDEEAAGRPQGLEESDKEMPEDSEDSADSSDGDFED
mmetsp:Transcript_23343/g.49757  ORF Transcript_23343/g.49757 Transcript_23343/m.49757 type:complete len:1144 (+) Transcript_23343:169-3600(+)